MVEEPWDSTGVALMAANDPVIYKNDPRDGVLCCGGPEHGRVLPIELKSSVYLFPVSRRLHAMDSFDPSPSSPMLATVRYDVEKFAVRWSARFAEQWYVLIYPENKIRLQNNLTGTANLVMWMADPTAWSFPADVRTP